MADWDAIIIGGGTAGMPAAIFAAQRSKRVLLIEKDKVLGGTLDRSSGQIAAAGTKLQALHGIADTPDEHYDDIMRINRGTSDPDLARVFVGHAAATIDWLWDHGFRPVDGHPVKGSGHEFFSKRRYCWGPENGVTIYKTMKPLAETAAASGNLTIHFETGAVELMQDASGAVTGVITEDGAGRRAEQRSRSVVLASGGCASNARMFHQLHGVPLYCSLAHPMAQGHGLTMGLAAGGYLRGAERYLCVFGSVMKDFNVPSPLEVGLRLYPHMRQPWEICVNIHGERFVREDHPSIDHRERALLHQPGQRLFVVFDHDILDQAPPLAPLWSREQFVGAFDRHPMFMSAPTVAELAAKMGVSICALQKTVNDYNTAREAGGSDPLGRVHMPLPIAKGPFYAVRAQGYTVKSSAGLAVDTSMRVLRPDQSVIPNLYAAGEVIGGGATSGGSFVNGMMVTPALVFGRMLGETILPL